jgi:hypothetical protein
MPQKSVCQGPRVSGVSADRVRSRAGLCAPTVAHWPCDPISRKCSETLVSQVAPGLLW